MHGLPRQYLRYATLAAALVVRIPGIGWGLPPDLPHVRSSDFRSSYSFDEDDILSGVAMASVARFDFDPREYHWGTLHLHLVLFALDGAEALGAFTLPWRTAYYNLVDADFVRVYATGRLVAVAVALLTVWLLFRLPAGEFAAMLVAVSPAHVLQSDQVRVDVTMAAMLVLMLVVANGRFRPWLIGFIGGLAIAAKYSAITAVASVVVVLLAQAHFPWRGILQTVVAVPLGFIAGGPYVAIKPYAFYEQINRFMTANSRVPSEFAIPAGKVIWLHVVNVVRFSMGPLAFGLALVGLVWMLRRRLRFDCVVLAALAGYAVILVPLRWPLIRYDLPLTILLGLAAGVALDRLPRWRPVAMAAVLVMPLAGCIAQIRYMRAPHPANLMLARILDTVPPGTPIARLFRESPPLDLNIYPLGTDIFIGDLSKDPPEWVLMTDLPDQPYRASNLNLLRTEYVAMAHTESDRILPWATFGERAAPHDWKYTHPSFTLYRRKSP